MVLAPPAPGSRWLRASRRGHPPTSARVERVSASGSVVFWEGSRVRVKTGREGQAKRQRLPMPMFLNRYRPLGQGVGEDRR